jgi:hypothetical protein
MQSILRHSDELSGPLRNIEPGEEERLADKIASLGVGDASAPMRTLLEKQLELIRALSAPSSSAGAALH